VVTARRHVIALLVSATLATSLATPATNATAAPPPGPKPAGVTRAPGAAAPQAAAEPSGPASYAYDAIGRLAGVTQASGETARYSYDAAGNVTKVERFPSAQLSVLSVVPMAAPRGGRVTISGTAFSPTPANNEVTINGAGATVVTASAVALTIEVPAAATTGTLAVTVGGVTAAGPSFTVTSGAPSITGLTPASGPPSTEVTITGTNFDPVVGNDVVTLGGDVVEVIAASQASLKFKVPLGASSGRVAVTSSRGTATAAQDFFVPPIGIDPALVESVTRVAVGTTTTVKVSTPGKVAVVLFDAPAKRAVSAALTSSTFTGSVAATVVGPDGVKVANGSDSDSSPFDLDLAALRAGQTHQVVIDPVADGDKGQVSLTLSEPLSAELSPSDAGYTGNVTLPGQDIRLSFEARAGQGASLGFSANTMAGLTYVSVTGPLGEKLQSGWSLSKGSTDSIDVVALPTSGRYDVIVDPQDQVTGKLTVTFSLRADAGVVARGGAAVTVNVARPGQDGAVEFDGTAGEAAGFGLTANTFTVSSYARIYAPDGTAVAEERLSAGDAGHLRVAALPVTGRYRLLVDPSDVGTGKLTVTYSARVNAGLVTKTGPGVTATVARAGQDAAVGFDAAANDVLSIAITGNTFTQSGYLSVFAPDGSRVLDSEYVGAGSPGDLDLPKLTVAGRYTAVFAPAGVATGSVTVTLSAEVAGGSGATRAVTFGRAGQNARLTFTGTAGQRLKITVPANTVPNSTAATLYRPDGASLGRVSLYDTSGENLPDLGPAGTYSIVLDPSDAGTGSITVGLATRAALAVVAPSIAPAALQAAMTGAPVPAPRSRTAKEGLGSWTPDVASLRGIDWNARRPKVAGPEPLTAKPGITALGGHLLTLDGKLLAGARVSAGAVTGQTDHSGRFLLTGVRAGDQTLVVDGGPASAGQVRYGVFHIKVTAVAGRTTTLPYTIWMQQLDLQNMVRFASPSTSETVLTTPKIPGLEVRLPKGSVVRDAAGKVVTELGITPIPIDRPPFPLPKNGIVPVYFTVQPGGTFLFPDGARVIYPNYTKLPPKTTVDFWNYDPEHRGWYVYGHGKVSNDARQVVPDAKTKIWAFHGAMFNTPSLPPWLKNAIDEIAKAASGDPVDLGTGMMTDSHTDLVVQDTLPISVTRNYWQGDEYEREFGIGWSGQYGMFLHSEKQYEQVDLYVPGGRKVHFVRTSAGTSYDDAVFEARGTTSEYTGAVISFRADPGLGGNRGWVLTRRDGMALVFPMYGPVAAIRDRHGNQLTMIRSDGYTGALVQITSPNGRWVKFTHDDAGRLTSARDNIGRTVQYGYDKAGHLTGVKNAAGGLTEYAYDSAGRLAVAVDARGISYVQNTFDSSGRVVSQKLTDGTTYTFGYETDPAGRITRAIVGEPGGSSRDVRFNSAGAVIKDIAQGVDAGSATTFEWSADQQLLSSTDHGGRKTVYNYDAQGRLLSTTLLAGTANATTGGTYTYGGPYDQPLTFTDPSGKVVTYTYEPDGDLASVKDSSGRVTTYTHDPAGNVLSATDPAGKVTTHSYRGGDLASVTDPLGRVMRQFTDGAGRVVSVTDPAGATSRISYDRLNQVSQVTDALGQVTSFAYDPNGNLLSLTDARGKGSSWSYDSSDRMTSMKDPLGQTATLTYNAAGLVSAATSRAGRVTGIEYDGLDRPTKVRYGALGGGTESSVTMQYDAIGRLASLTDTAAAGPTTFEYDHLDAIKQLTMPEGTVTYSHDRAGRRTQMLSSRAQNVTYGYDAAGELTGITQGTDKVALNYDAAGRENTVTLPGGWAKVIGRDAAGQATSLTYRHGGVDKGTLAYTYDAAGRIASVTGSLAKVTMPAPRSNLVYDAANRLTSAGGVPLKYDPDGNLLNDGTSGYSWNARGELAKVAGAAGAQTTFGYDPLGDRTGRKAGATSSGTLNEAGMPVAELTGPSPSATLLAGGTDNWFSRTDTGGQRTFLTDLAGSTVGLGDAAGAIRTSYSYDPFGTPSASGDTSTNRFQYTGRETDGTGLLYYRARYYSPTLQRFISEDPAGFGGGTNLYAYAANSPTNYTDPSGNNPIVAGCLGGAAVEAFWSYFEQRLGGRKVDWGWGGVGGAAAMGCAAGGAAAAVGAAVGGGGAAPGANCVTNSFDADTPVLLADGTSKPIAEIEAGDRVLAVSDQDPSGRAPEARTVLTVITGIGEKKLVDVTVEGGGMLTATDGHPFWLPDEGRWATAGELHSGQWLQTGAGTRVQISAVAHRTAWERVYNLTVDEHHTFYALAGEVSVLVHNCKGVPNAPMTYKPGWTPAQRAAADAKVNEMNRGGPGVVTKVNPNGSSAARTWEKSTGRKPSPGMDIDHKKDRQIGGPDHIDNYWELDKSVNRSLGRQAAAWIKKFGLGPGDKVCFSIGKRGC